MDSGNASNLERRELEILQLFRSVDLDAVEPLLRNGSVRRLEPGDVLIGAAKPNRHLHLLLEGRLSVRLGAPDATPLTGIEAGESVGEISLIDHQPASAWVVAETACRVLTIDEELLWILVNTSHAVSSNLLFTLARRLRYGNDVIIEDREQLKEYRFHATVDALTGLFNRYWLNIMLPRQMGRSRASTQPLSLLLVDIDHFKRYNDLQGHLAGDRVLCAVATSLRTHLRPSDMAARFGGEEFAVLLPDTPADPARLVAERLRRAVENCRVSFAHGPQLPPVTISLGVAEMDTEETPEDLIGAADTALYRAKSEGRNRVAE